MFLRSLKHFTIIECWRCGRELDNIHDSIVIMTNGKEQVTVCAACATELEKQGWIRLAGQK